MDLRRACRLVGRLIGAVGVLLAAAMVASAGNPAVAHPPTTGQTASAVLFVLACTAVVSVPLLAFGRSRK
jgi:hypothetical protein